jgi:WD40 repeat protein
VGLLLFTGLVATIAAWEGISARALDEKTRVAASQANVSLARYSHDAGKDAQALAHLAQALRLNPKNYEAAALTSMLLTQTGWALPVADLTRNVRIFGSLQFSPDGRRVVTTSKDGIERLWDAATGKTIGEAMKHKGSFNSAQFSPDGRRVDFQLQFLFDTARPNPIAEHPVENLSFIPVSHINDPPFVLF